MRLTPIEKPKGTVMRIAYSMSKKYFGKVISPLKTVYARAPKSIKMVNEISKFTQNVSLDHSLVFLIQCQTALINGCAFCVDIARAQGVRNKDFLAKFDALGAFEESDLFSQREKAALEYTAEATLHKTVSDTTFKRLKQQFNEQEIVEITLMNAIENYYNLTNMPLGVESDGLCMVPLKQPVAPAAEPEMAS